MKQEAMNVEKEEEELEEKVCASTVGSRGLCRLFCRAAAALGLSVLSWRASCSPASPYALSFPLQGTR